MLVLASGGCARSVVRQALVLLVLQKQLKVVLDPLFFPLPLVLLSDRFLLRLLGTDGIVIDVLEPSELLDEQLRVRLELDEAVRCGWRSRIYEARDVKRRRRGGRQLALLDRARG